MATATPTPEDLKTRAAQVRDAEQEQENSALRVGRLLVDLIDLLTATASALEVSLDDAIEAVDENVQGLMQDVNTAQTAIANLQNSLSGYALKNGSTAENFQVNELRGYSANIGRFLTLSKGRFELGNTSESQEFIVRDLTNTRTARIPMVQEDVTLATEEAIARDYFTREEAQEMQQNWNAVIVNVGNFGGVAALNAAFAHYAPDHAAVMLGNVLNAGGSIAFGTVCFSVPYALGQYGSFAQGCLTSAGGMLGFKTRTVTKQADGTRTATDWQ